MSATSLKPWQIAVPLALSPSPIPDRRLPHRRVEWSNGGPWKWKWKLGICCHSLRPSSRPELTDFSIWTKSPVSSLLCTRTRSRGSSDCGDTGDRSVGRMGPGFLGKMPWKKK